MKKPMQINHYKIGSKCFLCKIGTIVYKTETRKQVINGIMYNVPYYEILKCTHCTWKQKFPISTSSDNLNKLYGLINIYT